jgi:putative addiction module killer protein
VIYTSHMMPTVVRTEDFVEWLDGLRDATAKAKVLIRIKRLEGGNPGDVAAIGAGLSEMRISHGPGYRVYYRQRGDATLWWRQGFARPGISQGLTY